MFPDCHDNASVDHGCGTQVASVDLRGMERREQLAVIISALANVPCDSCTLYNWERLSSTDVIEETDWDTWERVDDVPQTGKRRFAIRRRHRYIMYRHSNLCCDYLITLDMVG